MIKYILKCHQEHEFESWFSDSKEFEKLNKKRLLECIYCSSTRISKSIMSPSISGPRPYKDNINVSKVLLDEKNKLKNLREYIEKNFEFVGDNFSKKVREVYYDKKNNRNIYGSTTPEEREELADEGIDLLSVPWISKDN